MVPPLKEWWHELVAPVLVVLASAGVIAFLAVQAVGAHPGHEPDDERTDDHNAPQDEPRSYSYTAEATLCLGSSCSPRARYYIADGGVIYLHAFEPICIRYKDGDWHPWGSYADGTRPRCGK